MANFSSDLMQTMMQTVLEDYRSQMNLYTDDFGLPFASCHEEIATLNDELENRLQSIRERARTLAQQDPRNFSATLASRTLALVYNFLINCFLIYLFIQVDHLPAFDYTTCFEFLPGLR